MTEDYDYIKSFFKEHAHIYDFVNAPLAGLREKTVDIVKKRDGGEVLDVATGTGKQAFAFARRGFKVTGIDLSEEMLQIARRKNKYPSVKFEVGDATSLPYESNYFDVTSISFALHDMPASFRGKVLSEMARVTKPEGSIVVIDYALPRGKIWRYLVYHGIKLYESKYYPDFAHTDLPALLKDSGIRIEEVRPAWLNTVKIYQGKKSSDKEQGGR